MYVYACMCVSLEGAHAAGGVAAHDLFIVLRFMHAFDICCICIVSCLFTYLLQYEFKGPPEYCQASTVTHLNYNRLL